MVSQELRRLGSRIRETRQKLDLTLSELAQKTGLSASYLSRVERGVSSPSLESLGLIARTFGQTVAELFDFQTKTQLNIQNTGLKFAGFSASLFTEFLNGNPQVKIALCTLDAKTSFPHKHTHKGEEVVHVLNGQVEVELGDKKRILNKGNSWEFQGNIPHNLWNPSDLATRLLIATVSPSTT